jgi:hypothetical protein
MQTSYASGAARPVNTSDLETQRHETQDEGEARVAREPRSTKAMVPGNRAYQLSSARSIDHFFLGCWMFRPEVAELAGNRRLRGDVVGPVAATFSRPVVSGQRAPAPSAFEKR